jgi:hypothetical protein
MISFPCFQPRIWRMCLPSSTSVRGGVFTGPLCTQHGSIRTLNLSLRVLNWLSPAFMRRCVATAITVCKDADGVGRGVANVERGGQGSRTPTGSRTPCRN